MALSRKRRAFVEYYLECWNGAEAARRAGYATRYADRQAAKLLKVPDVQELISQRLASLTMTADEVLVRLAEQARGEAADYIYVTATNEPRLDLASMRADGKTHLIKSFEVNMRGVTRFEMYDAQSALALIGKHHRLFTDRIEEVHTIEIDVKDRLAQRLDRLAAGEPESGADQEPDR